MPKLLLLFWATKPLSLLGLVEGNHGGLGLHPGCLLLAVGCFSKCSDLAMYVSGVFAKGLVSGATVCIKLL